MSAALVAAGTGGAGRGQRFRLATWLLRAWRRLGWRQVALAALLSLLAATFGPLGGVFLFPGERRSDPFVELLAGRWLCGILPLVFAAMVADQAYEDGVGALVAYGVALVVGAIAAGFLDAGFGFATGMGWGRSGNWLPNPFRLKQALLQGGLAIAMYAYWRTTQRALRRVQAAEAERVIGRQQLLAARLMTLQARVEPQFLFDALSRVGRLHEHEPRTADSLLNDLIALLRAMLPVGSAATSTVEREFALASAWLRVQRHLGEGLDLAIEASPLSARSGLGPMLVLPLLQEILAVPRATSHAWRLHAELVAAEGDIVRAPRLSVRLEPRSDASPEHTAPIADSPPVERLRERLAELYGRGASLSVETRAGGLPAFALDLPLIKERTADDLSPDH